MTFRSFHQTSSIRNRMRTLTACILSLVLALCVTQAVAPDGPISQLPNATARELTVPSLLDATVVDENGKTITEIVHGELVPHELRLTISIPEGVQDGDELRFITTQENEVKSGWKYFSPGGVHFLEGSTSQIMSSGDDATVIADVIADTSNSFTIVFNQNADAERGSTLYENAYDVTVLLSKSRETNDLSPGKVWTDDPQLNGTDAEPDEGHVKIGIKQMADYTTFGETIVLFDQDYYHRNIYDHSPLYYSKYSWNSANLYGGSGSPQPTEMLIEWRYLHADVHLASSSQERDLTFSIDIPDGVQVRKNRWGSYGDFRVCARKYTTLEEAKARAEEKNQRTGGVYWGEFAGDCNEDLKKELEARATMTLSEDGRVATFTVPNAPAGYSYRIETNIDRQYSEYLGAEEEQTWRLTVPESSQGEGAVDKIEIKEMQRSHTAKSVVAARGGISDPTQVRRSANMTVKIGDADGSQGTVAIQPGMTTYTVRVHNTSNVAVRLNTITLPNGEVRDMNDDRIRAGSVAEYTFELDESAFARNKDRTFTATLALMDDVSDTITISTKNPEYAGAPSDIMQTVENTIPAPDNVTAGVTFGPADNTPAWVTVNPDGTLTVTPPKRLPAGEHTIPVKVTYSDGSFEIIEAKINVIEAPVAEVDSTVIVISGEQPDSPADVVSNFADLPEGTTIEWKSEVPTDKLGQSEHVAVVTYPDGSKEEIRVPVAVVINQEQYERLQNERDKARESVNALDKRLNNGLGRCIGTVGGSLLALIPAVVIAGQLLGGLHIPELDRFFADTQRQLGVYNPDLAKIVYDNRGAIGGALAAVSIIPLFLIPDMCRDASIAGAVGEQLSS